MDTGCERNNAGYRIRKGGVQKTVQRLRVSGLHDGLELIQRPRANVTQLLDTSENRIRVVDVHSGKGQQQIDPIHIALVPIQIGIARGVHDLLEHGLLLPLLDELEHPRRAAVLKGPQNSHLRVAPHQNHQLHGSARNLPCPSKQTVVPLVHFNEEKRISIHARHMLHLLLQSPMIQRIDKILEGLALHPDGRRQHVVANVQRERQQLEAVSGQRRGQLRLELSRIDDDRAVAVLLLPTARRLARETTGSTPHCRETELRLHPLLDVDHAVALLDEFLEGVDLAMQLVVVVGLLEPLVAVERELLDASALRLRVVHLRSRRVA